MFPSRVTDIQGLTVATALPGSFISLSNYRDFLEAPDGEYSPSSCQTKSEGQTLLAAGLAE
jgi:hypothetical protein